MSCRKLRALECPIAESVTVISNFGVGNDGHDVFMGTIAPFNPALGQLTSVDVELFVQYDLTVSAVNLPTGTVHSMYQPNGNADIFLAVGDWSNTYLHGFDVVIGPQVNNFAPRQATSFIAYGLGEDKLSHIGNPSAYDNFRGFPDLGYEVVIAQSFTTFDNIQTTAGGSIDFGYLWITYNYETAAVPGPIVGAGLPGLVAALGGLLVWRRRRMTAA